MPRFKRLIVPGMPHHIVQRGNRRMNVFLDDNDRLVFLRIFSEVSQQYGLLTLGYNLMTNHEHFVAIPEKESSLSITMRDLLGPYASYFNCKYGLKGRLWQGRYYSAVLDESHFWAALRYIERNPVRAGIVPCAEHYRWSSAPAHCGLSQDALLSPLPPAAALLGSWSDWLKAGDSQAQLEFIRKCTKTGRPCGRDSYIRELEQTTGRVLIPQRVGRPSKRDKKDASVGRDPEPEQQKLFASDGKI